MRLIYLAAKVRLGFLIMACALAGIAVSPSSALSNVQIIVLALAVLLSSSITGAFNQLYERDIDAVMLRTQHRPFVTGQFLPSNAWKLWLFFLSLIAIMIAYLAANMEAALFLFAGSFTYAVIYTVWLKRKTWMNIVIGGFAGSFAVL
ncbi:MAG TPA: UbiA family prenyltransferase, partial [Gammaproteobacteria bacterium]|nr:UbiA family prenyltransferase [Gammaproteobacteria bacterium]